MINKLKYLITFFLFITNYQILHSDELSLLSDEKLDINELNILIKEYILKNPEKNSLHTGPKLKTVNDYRYLKRLEIKQMIEIFEKESKKVLNGEVEKIEEEFMMYSSVFVDENISSFKTKNSESDFNKIIDQENLVKTKELISL